MNELIKFQGLVLPAIDQELRDIVSQGAANDYTGLTSILSYQLGWEGEGSGPNAQGKRLRPFLVGLTANAFGGDWKKALPAAAAVELLHNFSLIHDDIEDASLTRRGRPTVWAKWGQPLAINAGDAMYALAFDALQRLEQSVNSRAALKAFQLITNTSIKLTGGQHLDISFENAVTLPLNSYWSMINGKTASLIAASMELGAICADADSEMISEVSEFGRNLGLAFQIQDDWLGIWGDESETGKSKASDLITGKKTLPILYGLENSEKFLAAWNVRTNDSVNIQDLAELLVEIGADRFTLSQTHQFINAAINSLEKWMIDPEQKLIFTQLLSSLVNRRQ